ncbi:MAG: hypothetical protein A4E23_01440 [Methanomethylovorans sp. PtaU1.Bin073]|nr:MAG: hypothetical protein A4E23_01440 [Methanomethylovorans sp. PtaU1.Bin073]
MAVGVSKSAITKRIKGKNKKKPLVLKEILKGCTREQVMKDIRESKGLVYSKENILTELNAANRGWYKEWYKLVENIETLNILVRFLPAEYNNKLLFSSYYQAMIPKIIETFEKSIPKVPINNYTKRCSWKKPTIEDLKNNIEFLRDTCNLKTGKHTEQLSAEDKDMLSEVLKQNYLALKFCLYFIFNEDKRKQIISNIYFDINDSLLNPQVAMIEGFMNSIEYLESAVDISEDDRKTIFNNRARQREEEPLYFWGSFFYILERLNKNYSFLYS